MPGPGTEPAPDLGLCRRIADYLSMYEGATKKTIEDDIDGRAERVRGALRWMAEEPRVWVRVERVGQAHRHYLTDEGREAFG
jgi:hypothetical protein